MLENTLTVVLSTDCDQSALLAMLARTGFDVSAVQLDHPGPFMDLGERYRWAWAHSADCLAYVRAGIADIGIVDRMALLEGAEDLFIPIELPTAKSQLCLFGKAGSFPREDGRSVRVGTPLPRFAERIFGERGIPVEVVPLAAPTPVALEMGFVDVSLDRRDLLDPRTDGFQILETWMELSTVVIANPIAYKLKRSRLGPVLRSLSTKVESDTLPP